MNNRTLARRLAGAVLAVLPAAARADLPTGFEQRLVIDGLADPATMAFAPDGRLFIGERIAGRLRIAQHDPGGDTWTLNPTPFYTFDIPKDAGGNPVRHRSSGLRGFAFDPDFANNGYVYAYYMKHDPRHNRVVRIRASDGNPDVADPGEMLLIELPFNATESSGSHNGGAVIFGADGMLCVTTGDGWNGGDAVQSLSTFTGKVLRIAPDETIPSDNPFYNTAAGDYRAIFALGLRNPFSVSRHPMTGQVYINDVGGTGDKTSIYELHAAANYGHQGYGGIGMQTGDWADSSTGGGSGRIISGGVWYPDCGPFPDTLYGAYFVANWGTNSSSTGEIATIASNTDATVSDFATDLNASDPAETLKPMYTAIGPNGHLFYLMSSYEADAGKVFEIRPTNSPGADANGNGVPDDCELPGSADFDGDGDVDSSDFAQFAQCFGGSNNPPASGCPSGVDTDLDGDGDVDLADFALFAQQFMGSV